tara:strand:- start:284 stop:490 length:207 start_codon:yes stop_codon:yes gene_type:complete
LILINRKITNSLRLIAVFVFKPIRIENVDPLLFNYITIGWVALIQNHFVDFYNDTGEKGYPKMKVKRL